MFHKLLFLVCLFSCSASFAKQENSHPAKPLILVSIAPYRYLVQEIAGDFVEVKPIVPSLADPHSYEPTLKQIYQMKGAKLWFLSGEPFEKACSKVFLCQTVDLNASLDLIWLSNKNSYCTHNLYDTHTWLSPRNLQKQTRVIYEALCETFPEYSATFEENFRNLIKLLEELDVEIAAKVSRAQNRCIAVTHSAFAYFCRDYALEQFSIENPKKREPSPKDIVLLLKTLKERNISCIVFSQLGNSQKSGHLVSHKLHLRGIRLNPYSEDIIENLRFIATTLSDL